MRSAAKPALTSEAYGPVSDEVIQGHVCVYTKRSRCPLTLLSWHGAEPEQAQLPSDWALVLLYVQSILPALHRRCRLLISHLQREPGVTGSAHTLWRAAMACMLIHQSFNAGCLKGQIR
ncbi:hypothetical protein SRHO_G00067690 [Serrasalmus rhombeus]